MRCIPDRWTRGDILADLHQRKIFGFFLIGVFSTVIDIGLLYILTGHLGIWYIWSATASYSCGMAINFLLNKYLNFRDTSQQYLRQFCSFALISVSSLILTLGILYVAVEIFALNYLTGKIIAVIAAFFWNYSGQSRITFPLGTWKTGSHEKENLP